MVAIRQDFLTDERQRRMEVEELKNDFTEMVMVNRIASVVGHKFALRAGRIVRGIQPTDVSIAFDDLLYDAYKSGAIDARERETLIMSDMIVSAVSRKSGARAYVAVEASFAISVRDVTKALNGGEILAKAFPDAETYSAACGRKISDEARSEADRRGVFIYAAPRDASADPSI